jgi:flagellar motor switch protein FliN
MEETMQTAAGAGEPAAVLETKPENETAAGVAVAEAAVPQAPAGPGAEESPAAPDAAAMPAETAAAEGNEAEEVQRVQYAPVQEGPVGQPLGNIEYLKDVNLEAGVELGNTTLSVEQILKLGVGSIVELNQTVGEPVRLLINNNVYALGEVVVIGDKFGVRIGRLMHAADGVGA